METQIDAKIATSSGSVLPLTRALVVNSGISRWGEVMSTSGDHVWTKVSGKDTMNAWSAFESRVPAGLNIPMHKHHSQEEWFWVLDGSFVFEVGGEKHKLTAGMSLLAPRHIPHRWRKTAGADGTLLILVQPAGKMEDFFEAFTRLSPEEMHDPAVVGGIFADCDMELLGPPMDVSDE